MARPKSISDDDVLAAAHAVIARRGPDAFTLAEVASEIGLSRAALILRFKSTHALKVTLLERMVDRFIDLLQGLPDEPGGDSLIEIASFIGHHIRDRRGLPTFFTNYASNVEDEELNALETKRGKAFHAVIARAMPETSISHDSAISAFSAHLTGNIVALLARDETDTQAFMIHRTKEWLTLTGIPFTDDNDKI